MLFRSDRKSTRLNSSHLVISYAVFCLKKKKKTRYDHVLPPQGVAKRRGLSSPAHPPRVPAPGQVRPWVVRRGEQLFPVIFFFNDTATTEIYPLSLHDALPI